MAHGNESAASSAGPIGRALDWLVEWLADVGAVAMDWVTAVGDVSLFAIRTISWLITRLPRKETLLPNFYQVGVRSLPVVAFTGTFIGMVLAVQSYAQFAGIGLETRLGGVINMSLVTELGPVLAMNVEPPGVVETQAPRPSDRWSYPTTSLTASVLEVPSRISDTVVP